MYPWLGGIRGRRYRGSLLAFDRTLEVCVTLRNYVWYHLNPAKRVRV